MQTQNEERERSPHAYKYAVQFDILPEISYLNEELPLLIADLLPIFHGFPQDVWISEKWVDEGLDFCRLFSGCAPNPRMRLNRSEIGFRAIFREPSVAEVLERLVTCALDDSDDIEVILTDWTRLAN